MERKLKEPTNAWQRFLIAEIEEAERRVHRAEGDLERCKNPFSTASCERELDNAREFEIIAWETYEAQWDAQVDMEEFEKESKA